MPELTLGRYTKIIENTYKNATIQTSKNRKNNVMRGVRQGQAEIGRKGI